MFNYQKTPYSCSGNKLKDRIYNPVKGNEGLKF